MLPKVSRTFALVISILTGEKFKAILLAYLLCRIADTIEDHPELPADRKQELLALFLKSLREPVSVDPIHNAFEPYHTDGPDEELTWSVHRVLAVYQTLSEGIRVAMVPSIEEMIRGMGKFQTFQVKRDSITALRDVTELEEYCYYVAGTVGVLLTNLFVQFMPALDASRRQTMEQRAISFGIGLQLTNIIKDYNTDLQRGWCYLPLTVLSSHGLTPELLRDQPNHPAIHGVIEELRNLARKHLLNALDYTLAVPRMERQIRLFCLWPLHMANQTLAAIDRNCGLFTGGTVKITRQDVKRTIVRTSLDWFSNRRQLAYFHQHAYHSLIP